MVDSCGHTLGSVRGTDGHTLQMRRKKRQLRRGHGRATSVVLVMAWLIVFITGAYSTIAQISVTSWIFLILSGLATGASWLCYYYAIQQGQVSVVVPIDRLSILITVLFSLIVFREKLSLKAWIGLALLTTGTVCMAVFT